MDLGPPISYLVLEPGTPVYSSDGGHVGAVTHVLAAEDEDVFDGIVIGGQLGSGGHRFIDADQISEIHRDGVLLRIDRETSSRLPEPSANPAAMTDDPADTGASSLSNKLKRAWDYISGNY